MKGYKRYAGQTEQTTAPKGARGTTTEADNVGSKSLIFKANKHTIKASKNLLQSQHADLCSRTDPTVALCLTPAELH